VSERDYSMVELAEDIAAIHAELVGVRSEMLRKDLYEAHHSALRAEIRLEVENIRTEMKQLESVAGEARAAARWAIGLVGTIFLSAVVGLLIHYATTISGT